MSHYATGIISTWRDVTCQEIAVAFHLADVHNGQTGKCFPSVEYIAKRVSLSKRQVHRILRGLEEKGYIEIIHKYDGNGRQMTSNYRFLGKNNDIQWDDTDDTDEGVSGDTGEDVSLDTPEGVADVTHIQEDDTGRSNTSRLTFDEEDMKTARVIFDGVKRLHPKHREPDFKKWANTVRLMRERDKRSHADIKRLFKWANINDFWQSNILSPMKLRKQWDMLVIKSGQGGNGKTSSAGFSRRAI